MPSVKTLSQATIAELVQRINTRPVSLAGRWFYWCFPWRKRVVLANIHRVFGQVLTIEKQKRLAKAFYSHMATSLWETVRLRFMSPRTIQRRGRVLGVEHVLAAAKAGRGVLVLAGHFGNWEIAPIAGVSNFPEFQGRFHLVRKSIRLQWLERCLFRRFFQAGLQVIPKRDAIRQALKVLAKNDVVVMVMDQAASLRARIGVATSFFGQPVGTYKSLALLASEGIPVVPALSYRDTDGQHVLRFYPALPWLTDEQPQAEIQRNSQQYNDVLERFVLQYPEQWFWMHRRWKVN